MAEQILMLFPNVHEVMKADRLCRQQGISCRVIPVPEQISSECGMCLVVSAENMEICRKKLNENHISFEYHNQQFHE